MIRYWIHFGLFASFLTNNLESPEWETLKIWLILQSLRDSDVWLKGLYIQPGGLRALPNPQDNRILFYFYFKKYLFIYICLCQALVVASGLVVVTHGLSCLTQHGMLVPRSGIEPASSALESRFLTSGPPEKSWQLSFKSHLTHLRHLEKDTQLLAVLKMCSKLS